MTFETYVLVVATGSVWGDKYVIEAIEHMFNLSISIVSPAYMTPWKIFHNSEIADIVVISNGFHFGHKKQPTHFSPTEHLSKNLKKIGHDVENTKVKHIHGDTEGRKAASKMFMLEESEQILKKDYLVSKKLDSLKKMVKNCEEELKNIEDDLHAMNYSKDCFHRFKSYMDNMNTPNDNRRIPKITFPQIMGEDIMNELLKAKSTNTAVSTETVQDVSESVVNPDVSIHVDLTNMHADLEESSPEITSVCVDSVSDANEPGAIPELNSGASMHGNQPKCTNSAHSEEDTLAVHETDTTPHTGFTKQPAKVCGYCFC